MKDPAKRGQSKIGKNPMRKTERKRRPNKTVGSKKKQQPAKFLFDLIKEI